MTDETHMKPPPRLMDDPSIAPELHEGLSELSATQLPFDTAAGLSAFESALGHVAPAASATATGTLVAGSVVLMLAGAGMYAWLGPSKPSPRPEKPAPQAAPAMVAPAVAVPEPPAAPELPAPTPPIKEEAPRNAVAAQTPLDREVAATVKAKALVESKPRAALALLQRLEREHPRGALSEERAGLRVLALWAAGEHAAARSERAIFLARYPESPMRERLMQLEAP